MVTGTLSIIVMVMLPIALFAFAFHCKKLKKAATRQENIKKLSQLSWKLAQDYADGKYDTKES